MKSDPENWNLEILARCRMSLDDPDLKAVDVVQKEKKFINNLYLQKIQILFQHLKDSLENGNSSRTSR